MNVVYFETKQFNYRNGLIYILAHIKVKTNKLLFNSREWDLSLLL